MRRIFGGLLVLSCCMIGPAHAGTIEAKTQEGRTVYLFADGTWRYKDPEAAPPRPGAFTKPQGATSVVKSQKGFVEFWYNPDKWVTPGGLDNPSTEFTFKHTSGDTYAMVVVERITIPIETLRQIGLDNARKIAPDAKIVLEEERTVNGMKILAVQLDATTKGIPIRYYNYYYSGKSGSIQLVTFTGQNLFEEFGADMQDLLNGMIVTKP